MLDNGRRRQGVRGNLHKGMVKETEKIVAIKVIEKKMVKNELRMLENEVCIQRAITHPNIVQFYDWF